jgi:hypothetical protein
MQHEAGYNIQAIHWLLREGYTQQELRRVCLESAALRPVVDDFGINYSLNEVIDEIVDCCCRRDLLDQMLAGVQRVNPAHYARLKSSLRDAAYWWKLTCFWTGGELERVPEEWKKIPEMALWQQKIDSHIHCMACGEYRGSVQTWRTQRQYPCPICGSYRIEYRIP